MAAERKEHKFEVNEQNISYYDAIAGSYNSIMDREDSNKLVRQLFSEKFKELVKEGTVLDFGGGTGLDLEWLAKGNYTVFFCEPSVEMRKQAIAFTQQALHKHDIVFLAGSDTDIGSWCESLPFSQKVDAIIANFAVLNCISNIDLLFRNLAQIIKPGGHLLAVILDNHFKRLLRSHWRSALSGFVFQRPIILHVRFNQHQQTVYLHTPGNIKRSSSAYFNFCSQETIRGTGFVMIHLTRK